jgi:hypothetical protein
MVLKLEKMTASISKLFLYYYVLGCAICGILSSCLENTFLLSMIASKLSKEKWFTVNITFNYCK